MGAHPARVAWGVVAVASVVGAVARIWHLNALGLNADEAVYSGQGASIAANDGLEPFFRIFRAHPLLFQTLVSLAWRAHFGATAGRWLAVGFGLGTVVLTFLLGRLLYGRRTGVVAAAFLLAMPYHVVVSRQILLDVPMAFFATGALYCVARFVRDSAERWLYAGAAVLGLAFLSKESAMLLVGGVYVFFVISSDTRVRLRQLLIAGGVLASMAAAFPLALTLSGGGHTGRNYLAWQLLRRPNHSWLFYLTEVPHAMGPLLVAAALAALVLLRHERTWRERLLGCWIAVPLLLFELWPVKGFQYLLPLAPTVAVLGARSVVRVPELFGTQVARWAAPAGAAVVCLTLAVPTWGRIQPPTTRTLAGAGGVPGGRDTGRWLAANTSPGSTFFTIGPSMANILEFYGRRDGFGLSVSPNPLARNPSYVPVRNPDLLLRRGVVRYLVWDAFSAQRSRYFSRRLLRYVDRYNARIVHVATVPGDSGTGAAPVVVVYRVPFSATVPSDRPLPKLPATPGESLTQRHRQMVVIYTLYALAAAATALLVAAALAGRRREATA
ncbi:MAG TPA: glycosyltransferase family 39 protein [Gaiellaceae bacterium]|nr:glycosyltransferase family 39 protein [Gaiellaceae bacterium]